MSKSQKFEKQFLILKKDMKQQMRELLRKELSARESAMQFAFDVKLEAERARWKEESKSKKRRRSQ